MHVIHRDEMRRPERGGGRGLAGRETLMEVDRRARLGNPTGPRAPSLDREAGATMICVHDTVEFEACAAGQPL